MCVDMHALKLCMNFILQAFSPGAMETFLARTIIPKLAITLDMLDINPRNQNIGTYIFVYLRYRFNAMLHSQVKHSCVSIPFPTSVK